MPRRFWILAVIWTLTIPALTPGLIEVLDRRGWALTVPGLLVTASEVVLAGAIVLIGIAALWLLHRRANG